MVPYDKLGLSKGSYPVTFVLRANVRLASRVYCALRLRADFYLALSVIALSSISTS